MQGCPPDVAESF
uniref:Uncharacterized protein n=1 Tax=Anguilla anguilla TaxID=7936 RepID=A0A0E9SV69_ANGAN